MSLRVEAYSAKLDAYRALERKATPSGDDDIVSRVVAMTRLECELDVIWFQMTVEEVLEVEARYPDIRLRRPA